MPLLDFGVSTPTALTPEIKQSQLTNIQSLAKSSDICL